MDKFTKDFFDGLDKAEREIKKNAKVTEAKRTVNTTPVKVSRTAMEVRPTKIQHTTIGIKTTTPKVTRVKTEISQSTVKNNIQNGEDEE